MGLGAQTIMNWEIMSVGIQWSNVADYTSPSAGKYSHRTPSYLAATERHKRKHHNDEQIKGPILLQ